MNTEPAEKIFLKAGDPHGEKLLVSQVYFNFCIVSGSAAKKCRKTEETTSFMLTPHCLCNHNFVSVEGLSRVTDLKAN